MPELPDVEATRRYLINSGLVDCRIVGMEFFSPGRVKGQGIEHFSRTLPGQRIKDVKRRAKYLLLPLAQVHILVMHLGMTGAIFVEQSGSPRPAKTRNLFQLDDGRELRLVDPRNMGKIWLKRDTTLFLGGLGPEPVDPDFTVDVLQACLGKRSVPVKALLLDQSVIAGIGNIYADELLFAARISPRTLGSSLSRQQVQKLHSELVSILHGAIVELTAAMPLAPPHRALPRASMYGTWSQCLSVPRAQNGNCSRCGAKISCVPVRGRKTYYCQTCQQ